MELHDHIQIKVEADIKQEIKKNTEIVSELVLSEIVNVSENVKITSNDVTVYIFDNEITEDRTKAPALPHKKSLMNRRKLVTSYFLFCADNRKTVTIKNSGKDF